MPISVFDLFSIGIGPSSSHTVGPMRAARQYVLNIDKADILPKVKRLKIDLYGSLALTGKGHATDLAVMLGSEGETPDGVNPDTAQSQVDQIKKQQTINLLGKHQIPFDDNTDLLFHFDKQLPFHPNGMRFTVYSAQDKELDSQVFYSIGGGFILDHQQATEGVKTATHKHTIPYKYDTADELLNHCEATGLTIPQLVMKNELTWRSEKEVHDGLLRIWNVMKACAKRGCHQEGILPGGLNVRRRAAGLYRHLHSHEREIQRHPAEVMEWVNLWALAVNEENAAGSRVVTAPTNGAAGIIPAVLHYYMKFTENASEEGIVTFMLAAASMGILFKKGASISAAEMGCMGEVGVACSMAAAGLTAALGGTNAQIENAAEIGMEHNLGLTCDPIKGLVQIPCIERNTMGAVKAINATLLALRGDGDHRVSLDQVIATMRTTGKDMQSIYKETSLGGLAVNVPEC